MVHSSQRETKLQRAIRKAEKIRIKLKWQPGIVNYPGDKPKGMHWSTYLRLMTEYSDYTNQVVLGMNAKMEIINNKVSNLLDRILFI
jgi:hypothetical protein